MELKKKIDLPAPIKPTATKRSMPIPNFRSPRKATSATATIMPQTMTDRSVVVVQNHIISMPRFLWKRFKSHKLQVPRSGYRLSPPSPIPLTAPQIPLYGRNINVSTHNPRRKFHFFLKERKKPRKFVFLRKKTLFLFF